MIFHTNHTLKKRQLEIQKTDRVPQSNYYIQPNTRRPSEILHEKQPLPLPLDNCKEISKD